MAKLFQNSSARFHLPAKLSASEYYLRLLALFLSVLFGSFNNYGVTRDGQVDSAFNFAPMWIGSGRITTSAKTGDNKLVVAGSFMAVNGRAIKNIARLNSDGSFDESFVIGSGPNDEVIKVFVQSDGKILVSGRFTQFNNSPRNRIVRLNIDGSIDQSFNPNFGNSFVQIGAVQTDGKMIIYGDFSSFAGFARNGLVRLNRDGSIDQSFDPGIGLSNGAQVQVMLVQSDDKILVGGLFRYFNNSPVNGLLRLNPDGSVDSSYSSNNIGEQIDELFDITLAPDGKIYVAGWISTNDKVIRLNTNGTLDAGFSANHDANGRIYSVAVLPTGKVLVGGTFDGLFLNGSLILRQGLFRFNSDGTPDSTFTAQLPNNFGNSGVYYLEMQNANQILVGGAFSQINGVRRGSLALMDLSGAVDASFAGVIGTKAEIRAFQKLSSGKILVAGNFDMIGNSVSRFVARLNVDGTVDNSFSLDSQIDKPVNSLAVQPNGKIILGGYMGIWRIEENGSLDSSFNALIPNYEQVNTIALQADGKILIGGNFNAVTGVSRQYLARLHANGTVDNSFNVTFGAPRTGIYKIALQIGGKILIGGDFATVNGQPTANFARLNSDASVDTAFQIGSGANGNVTAILANNDGTIFVGGNFFYFNGQPKRGLVKLESDGRFSPNFDSKFLSAPVSSVIILSGGKILISGSFSTLSNVQPRAYVARLLSDGSVDYSFNLGPVVSGTATAGIFQVGEIAENKILAIGFFDSIGGIARSNIAQLNINLLVPRPVYDFDGDGKTEISIFRPSNGAWYWINSFNNQVVAYGFGLKDDKVLAEDFDGDFRTDLAVFRPSSGVWYVLESGQNRVTFFKFGLSEDIPVAGDFDGDGRADYVVFRPSTGVWYLYQTQAGFAAIQFGTNGDVPVAADYDGDRRADLAVFRPSVGEWWYLRSSDGGNRAFQFGSSTDKPVPADYTGDGKADVAFFRPSVGEWFVLRSEDSSFYSAPFGANGDIPVPGDYDGDGKADLAVWRSTDRNWYLAKSTGGFSIAQFGLAGDKPVPSAFVP